MLDDAKKRADEMITESEIYQIAQQEAEKMLAEAAKESGRKARCLEIRTQAPDHPSLLNAEETSYLKFFALQIS